MDGSQSDDRYSPRTLAGLYLAFGIPWILVTDVVVAAFFAGSPTSGQAQLLKGLVFVFGSGAFLYVVVRRRADQLAAERASLRETRNRVESIIEASPVPIIALDPDGTVMLWNSAAESTFGWTAEEAVGETPKYVGPESMEEFRDNLRRVRDGESFDGVEITRRTKRGETRQFSLSTAPIGDAADGIDGVMAVMVDITARKQRESELLRYKRLMENLPVGVFRTDPVAGGRFTEANSALLSMFDADTLAELSDNSIRDFYVDESERERVLEQFDTADTVTVETRLRTLDDDVFWARMTGLKHDDEAGHVVVDGIVEDVTDSRERTRQFEVIDRILRHNFRNILGIIIGHAELLRENADSEAVDSAEQIHSHAESLLELSEKERVIVKLLSGEVHPSTQDLSAFVARQTDAVRDRYPDATVEVEYPPECTVRAVPQVEAAIGELLENAIVHNDTDDPAVRVTGEQTDDAVITHIEDTGPGIPASELAEFQLDQPIDQLTHGTGLDLWLTYWAVTASDGTIDFEENTPRGTVVTIELPRDTDEP